MSTPVSRRTDHGPAPVDLAVAPDLDPRLVALYDLDNPDGPDHDFVRAVVTRADPHDVLDLGCGTGLLTVTLVQAGRSVVGVDPSAAMLDAARARPGGDAVEWVHGDTRAVSGRTFDMVVMTGNVAQHIGPGDWERTLADCRAALRPGGVLVFDSRAPGARAWETWTTDTPTVRSTPDGDLTEWSEAEETSPGTVRLVAHNRFDDGPGLTYVQDLHFRAEDVLRGQLTEAGFAVDAVLGDWSDVPAGADTASLVVIARAA